MNEFLPCPLCGRSPQITSRGASPAEWSTTGEMWFAACHGGGYAAHVHVFAYSITELIDLWNRRTPPPPLEWSSEPPKAPGWYWMRYRGWQNPSFAHWPPGGTHDHITHWSGPYPPSPEGGPPKT